MLGLMRLHQFRHAVENEISMRERTRVHGGPKSLIPMSAVDPSRLQAGLFAGAWSWNMLSAVCKISRFLHAQSCQVLQHVVEIARIRLVGANILGRKDRVEIDL